MRVAAWVFLFLDLILSSGCISSMGRKINYDIDTKYSVEDGEFLRTMGQLVGPGFLPGNKVTAYVNGDEIFPAMLESIKAAQKTIDFETYIYWAGEIGKNFADALAGRATNGVQVHVLVDWLGANKMDSKYIKEMEVAGVQFERYHPLHWYDLSRINHRTHRKILVVDGKVAFTGGVGIADEWTGNAQDENHWRDSHFKLEGPAVAQMQAAFMDNWLKTHEKVLHGDDYFPQLSRAGNEFAQAMQSSPREGSENLRLMYLLAIAAAQKNIKLSAAYFVPGSRALKELQEARKRGVNIEIIVPGKKTDVQVVRHASHAYWYDMLKSGIRIYEYQPTMYHCKIMIVDDVWVSVGSGNFDNRSFALNDEANLNVYSPEFAKIMSSQFEKDKQVAREMTMERWKQRSIFKRVKERISTLFWYQL
ncbi:MAG: cls [Verrucomicrobiales bacterium]|nr:cls [Verrucomicrobiales bacterium]